MEEDAGVKAPVTRLRRRLSVEQTEESKSPAVSTPTKKRGGRKAAKPELELIDENTPTNTTTRKATTKTATKDVVEPEEKNLTPARRTTRIKSNTSIISETALAVESPRAKRAARRASTTGSDYEAAVTPIRQTRRTRKDSTSSIEKEPQQPPPKQEIQITEVIIEEPDSITTVKSTPQPEKTPSTNPRKSPRLLEKINKTSPGKIIEQSSDESKPATNHSKNSADSISISQQEPTDNSKRDSETSQDAFSTVSDSVIKEVNTTPKKSKLRKSFSSAESKENLTKRNRTKSWTNLSASSNSKLYSDNENSQNGIINDLKIPLVIVNNVSSIHSSSNASLNQDTNIADKSISSPKKKDCVNLQVENIDVPDKTNSIQNKNKTESETVSLDKYMNTKQQSKDALASEIFKKNPSRDMKVTLFIEDTPDSNSDKINLQTSHDNEDQRVPEVVHPVETFQSELNSFSSTLDKQNMLNKSKEPRDNDCEPMDIDETIPENFIMAGAQSPEKNISSIKLSSSLPPSNLTTEEMENVSRRQSSIIQSLNKSEIATKSTLILSQIKDSPTGVVNNLGKSLQVSNNELLSQSVDDLNITQESDVKKKLSLHYSTSTPLQDKNIQKLKGIQVNTSIIAMQNNDSKNIINHDGNLSKNQYENLSYKNDSVASHDGNLKDTLKRENSERNTDTSKNKGKGRNSSKKYIENEMIHSSEDEKMDSEKDKSIDNHTNISINDKKVCTSQNKSKSADIPSEEKHINESDDDNAETSSLRNEVFNASGNYKPEEKDIKSDMVNSSQNEKMESDGDTSIDNNTNINLSDKNACKLENESKSADLLSEKQNTSSESEEEYESDEDSVEKSNLLDDEAFDAGDDYESGDSQDDSERQFEKENEIIDKGVTLTSEEEFSDDSDYEKDSFLVSSNEEDNELLDGSDDDLSMSDNELKMTTTSKKKFNERKVKEQKKASREMFESRNKLNSSKNSSNASILSATKNKKRLQISSSESEEDIPAKPKKYNRLRLDSTKEASLLNDESEHKISKKKNRHLPDTSSSSDESIPKEKEITICDETIKESDPLSQIKTEPKTPIKSANSSIAFMDTENVNNDEIDKNESTVTQIEVDDPLQATMAADDESLSSDNENIMQNYDSVLQDLNKNKNSKVKACDISLNLDNKKKKTAKVALVDELNLTQLKSPRRTKSKHTEEVINSAEEMPSNTAEDASSDSIDLHLLFSEDSNSSETSALQNKMKTANDDSEVFIPLKKTEAKTDIRDSKDEEQSMEVSFNQSIVKANKQKSQQHESTSSGDEHPSFFVDTVGTLGDPSDKTHDDSLKINKKQSTENSFAMEKSVNKSVSNAPAEENSEDDSPLEISYKKEKKRSSKVVDVSSVAFEKDTNDKMSNSKTPSSEKKKKNKSMDANISVQATEDLVADRTINKSILKTPCSEKKHKKKSMDANISIQEDCVADKTVNKSITKTPASGKKRKKKSMDADDILEQADSEAEQTINKSTIKTPGSEKKLKKKSIGAELVELEADTTDVAEKTLNKSIAKTPNSEKKHKNKSMNVDISEQEDYVADKTINKSITEMPGSEKKRKKKSMNADISEQAAETTDVADKTHNKSIAKTPNSEKKHKNKSMNADISEQADSVTDTINKSITEIPDSEKKQRKSVNADISEQADPVADKTLNKSIAKTPASEKKLKNKSMDAESSEQADIVCDSTENKSTSKISNSEKQNKHQSGSHAGPNDEITENTEISSKKRKRQSSLNTTKEEIHPTDVAEVLKDSLGNEKKKRKIATEDATATVSVEITVKRNRKRKEPEEDVPSNQTKKMVKEAPVFNKVPRLPSTVLKQLDNAPDKQVLNQKPEVISTTQFLVQEAKRRKTKPSNYLEESIYLNDHTENTRNVKKRLEKPKVLPFVPTASTSSSGFTTNFKINVVPNEFKFVAQSNSVSQSFKDNYLYGPKIKRVGTYDLHKRRRNIKLSKF